MPPKLACRLTALLLLCAASIPAQVAPGFIQLPTGLACDPIGNLYFADTNRHQVFESTLGGQLRLVAGTGTQGYTGDNGPATAAQLNAPQALAFAADGTLYIADTGNNVIRAVTQQGIITTVAGTGTQGYSGDNGPATAAALASPNALAVDSTGALVIADSANHRLRRITQQGTITTVAGTGTQGFSGDNGPATAAQLDSPSGIAIAPDGRIFLADTHNHRVRVISTAGIITTFAGTGQPGFSGDSGPAANAQLDSPRGLALTSTGALLIADADNQRIRTISPQGTVSTLAGTAAQGTSTDGTPALAASLNTPRAITLTSFGYPAIADAPNHTLRILAADNNLYLPASLTSRTSTITLGASSVATITVTGQVATPQGSVQLLVDGALAATLALSSGAATMPLASLSPGTHTLIASYIGDGLNPAATSSAFTLTSGKATTAVVTQPPAPNDYAGLPLLLNANVTSTTQGTPTGVVIFTEAGSTLATAQLAGGIAAGVYLNPTAGTHTITANYLGDASFSPGTAPAVIAIVKPMPDFAIASSGTSTQTVATGAIATYTIAITPQNGPFTGAVSLSATGLPSGATASFAPPQVVPGSSAATSTLSIQTPAPIVRLHTASRALYALLFLPLLYKRRRHSRITLMLLSLSFIAVAGCGTRINQPPTPAAGTYTLTLTATGTNLAGNIVVHATSVQLTIE